MCADCLTPTELHAAAAKPDLRAEGVLQRISGQLLQQVPFRVLQAQVGGYNCWLTSKPECGALTELANALSNRMLWGRNDTHVI
jgi:hypothetical protein